MSWYRPKSARRSISYHKIGLQASSQAQIQGLRVCWSKILVAQTHDLRVCWSSGTNQEFVLGHNDWGFIEEASPVLPRLWAQKHQQCTKAWQVLGYKCKQVLELKCETLLWNKYKTSMHDWYLQLSYVIYQLIQNRCVKSTRCIKFFGMKMIINHGTTYSIWCEDMHDIIFVWYEILYRNSWYEIMCWSVRCLHKVILSLIEYKYGEYLHRSVPLIACSLYFNCIHWPSVLINWLRLFELMYLIVYTDGIKMHLRFCFYKAHTWISFKGESTAVSAIVPISLLFV